MTIHDPNILRAATANIRLGGLGVRLLAAGIGTGGNATLLEHPLAPRSLGAPLHTHSQEDEFSYIVEGQVGFLIGDRVLEAKAGDFVAKPRGIPHAFWNATNRPAHIIELIVPGGFEGYFSAMAAVFNAPQPDHARAGEICGRYGITLDIDSICELHRRFGLVCPS